MARHLVVVDVETTGLGDEHVPVEIAYWDLASGERGRFLPPVTAEDLARADPAALRMNRYYERGLHLEPADDSGMCLVGLHRLLDGNVFAGSNPAFDVWMLNKVFRRLGTAPSPWRHYRLADLRAYAAGVFGLPPTGLPSLSRVCELLGVPQPDHSAVGDVLATGRCFLKLLHGS